MSRVDEMYCTGCTGRPGANERRTGVQERTRSAFTTFVHMFTSFLNTTHDEKLQTKKKIKVPSAFQYFDIRAIALVYMFRVC